MPAKMMLRLLLIQSQIERNRRAAKALNSWGKSLTLLIVEIHYFDKAPLLYLNSRPWTTLCCVTVGFVAS